MERKEGYSLDKPKENSVGEIVDKIDLDNGWWYCAKDIGKTLAKTTLSGLQRAIIDCILDKTFGWHDPKAKKGLPRKRRKIWADIKGKEFEEYTGVEANKVSEAISYLDDNNIIKRKKQGWKKQYSFNVNVSEWNKGIFRKRYKDLLPHIGNYSINENDLKGNNNKGLKPENDKLLPHIGNYLDKDLLPHIGKITSPNGENDFPKRGSNNRCDTIKDEGLLIPNKSLKGIYIKEEEKDHTIKDNHLGEEEGIFNYWNTYNINPGKNIKPYIQDIREALKDYSIEEIQLAISNYAFIVNNKDYILDYQYNLDTFLKGKTIEKFLDLERAKGVYKINKLSGYATYQDNQDVEEGEYNIPEYKPNKKDDRTIEEIRIERERISNLAGIEARKMNGEIR